MVQVKKVVLVVNNEDKTFSSQEEGNGVATIGNRVIIINDSNHELKEKDKLLDRGYKEK